MLGEEDGQPFDELIQFPAEMLDNQEFYLAYIKTLIICCSNIKFKVKLQQSYFKQYLKEEIASCYIDEDLVIDERYLALRFLEINLDNLRGGQDNKLPSLTSPSFDSRPMHEALKRSVKISHPRQYQDLEQFLSDENINKGQLKDKFNNLVQSTRNIDQQMKETIVKYIIDGHEGLVESNDPHCIDQVDDDKVTDMLYNYVHNIKKFCIDFESFTDLIEYGKSLKGNKYLISSLIFMCGEDTLLARALLEHVSQTKIWKFYSLPGIQEVVLHLVKETIPRAWSKLENLQTSGFIIQNLLFGQNWLTLLPLKVNCSFLYYFYA